MLNGLIRHVSDTIHHNNIAFVFRFCGVMTSSAKRVESDSHIKRVDHVERNFTR